LKKNIVKPYYTVQDENIVQAEDWFLVNDEEYCSVKSGIEGWDYQFDLELERKVSINKLDFIKNVGLEDKEPEVCLSVVSTSGPPGNTYRLNPYSKVLSPQHDWDEEIQIKLKGIFLSSQVNLQTIIYLGSDLSAEEVLVPSRGGSILWDDEVKIELEGSLSRFPMQAIKFDNKFPPKSPDAMWHLSWDPYELEDNFRGTVILYLNSTNETLMEKIENSDSVLISAMMSDVVRQMCFSVINENEDLVFLDECSDESVGSVIKTWINICFEGIPYNEIKGLKQNELESRIQSIFYLEG